MINVSFKQSDNTIAARENESLQEYVHALLARQQALDLLETIHQQVNQVWTAIRKLLDGAGTAVRAAKAVRAARAAQAAQAQSSYRSLEKRREECIAALHEAERRANAALQNMLSTNPQFESRHDFALPLTSRAHGNDRLVGRPLRRKLKNACSGHN